MKIRVWCDSGANIYSRRVVELDTSELGISDEEWKDMSEEDRESNIREVAFERLETGWEYVT